MGGDLEDGDLVLSAQEARENLCGWGEIYAFRVFGFLYFGIGSCHQIKDGYTSRKQLSRQTTISVIHIGQWSQ